MNGWFGIGEKTIFAEKSIYEVSCHNESFYISLSYVPSDTFLPVSHGGSLFRGGTYQAN